MTHESAGIDAVLGSLLKASHLLEPDDLPDAVRGAAQRLGAADARIYLADYDQDELRHLVCPGHEPTLPVPIDGTVPGRVYRTEKPAELTNGDGTRLLLPLVDGSHRIGVLEVRTSATRSVPTEQWLDVAALVAELLVSKSAYGDTITVTHRRQPLAVRAEAQRGLLPPLTLTSPRLLVTGMVMPSYDVAGDAFDYALNGDVLHLAVLDAMGHSLSATLTAAVAIAAYRNTRRHGGSLVDAWRSADEAVAREFGGERFATAILGELSLTTGLVRTLSAGHPPALVVRDNRVVARCADDPTLPIGLGGQTPDVTETRLQRGDRLLLFTDGIVEARSESGEFFGEERLVEQLARELDTDLPVPEAARRLMRAVADHQSGTLHDDATLLLVEWRASEAEQPGPTPVPS